MEWQEKFDRRFAEFQKEVHEEFKAVHAKLDGIQSEFKEVHEKLNLILGSQAGKKETREEWRSHIALGVSGVSVVTAIVAVVVAILK